MNLTFHLRLGVSPAPHLHPISITVRDLKLCLVCIEVGCKDNYLSIWNQHWNILDWIARCVCVWCVCAHTCGHCLLFELAAKMLCLSTFKQHPSRLCIPKMARTQFQPCMLFCNIILTPPLPSESGQVLWSMENDGSGPVPNIGIVLWTILDISSYSCLTLTPHLCCPKISHHAVRSSRWLLSW